MNLLCTGWNLVTDADNVIGGFNDPLSREIYCCDAGWNLPAVGHNMIG